MPTVIFGSCEWDATKAEENAQTHGVSFPEAATVLDDPNALYLDSGDDMTVRAIGFSAAARVLTVVHIERGTRDRIISAWVATAAEENRYNNG